MLDRYDELLRSKEKSELWNSEQLKQLPTEAYEPAIAPPTRRSNAYGGKLRTKNVKYP